MRIVKRNQHIEPTCKTACSYCRSELEVEKKDCVAGGDQRDGGYKFNCPACNHENWLNWGAFTDDYR